MTRAGPLKKGLVFVIRIIDDKLEVLQYIIPGIPEIKIGIIELVGKTDRIDNVGI